MTDARFPAPGISCGAGYFIFFDARILVFLHKIQVCIFCCALLILRCSLRANVPHLNAQNLKFLSLIRKWLISECLTVRADALVEAGVHPEAVSSIARIIVSVVPLNGWMIELTRRLSSRTQFRRTSYSH